MNMGCLQVSSNLMLWVPEKLIILQVWEIRMKCNMGTSEDEMGEKVVRFVDVLMKTY